MLDMRLRRARLAAHKVLADLGMQEPEHIDPIETANELGIEITFGNLDHATARIFRIGTKAARIRVSDRIVQPGRRRFSIAHEIGHFVLGHQLPRETDVSSFVARACWRGNTSAEREADVFAIEHNTPEDMVRPYCASPVTLGRVRAIEKRFTASPVASARRFVELTNERCAVVYSVGGEVKWARGSRTFAWRIPERMQLSSASIAGDYLLRGILSDAARAVTASAWVPDIGSDANIELFEHAVVIPEPGWGGVMSLIWIREHPAQRRA